MRTKEAIRRRIQELCMENNLTVNGLRTKCGMTQSPVNNIISGRNNSTTIATVKKIWDGLDMELPEFFDSDLFRNLEQEIY